MLSVLIVTSFLFPNVAIATPENQESILYNNRVFNVSDLSNETLRWLNWYNSLPTDLKETISYEPTELRELFSPELTFNAPIEYADELSFPFSAQSYLPTGGYELAYNPNFWNNDANIRRANCYAYVMNILTSREGKLQPEELSGNVYTSLTKSAIEKAAKADGSYIRNGVTITNSFAGAVPGKSQYKIALVIAPNKDYHWYIQNSDGFWSHKRGLAKVSMLDASGKVIWDPQSANRNYGSGLNYSIFAGYYLVKYK